MKKILSLTLTALLLAALLAGCGGAGGGAAEEKGITGSWAADVDMTEYLNEMLSEDEEIGQFLTLDNFTIKLLAEFKEDGTYTMAGDPESAQAAMDSLKEQLKGALTDYLQAMIDESGMDTTVEELLTEADMTMDDLMAEMDEAYSAEDLVGDLNTVPAFVIAKGGITSSDVGTKALKVKRARVLGQIRPGIPVWQTGPESRFPGTPYVIFPGNVGDVEDLRKAAEILMGKER